MRTYLKWSLPVLVIGLLSYLAWGFTTKLHHKQEANERVQTLPNFKAEGINNVPISQADFQNKPAVLLYFNSDCDHCQREADELRQQANKLDSAQVLMLSSEPVAVLQAFARAHKLNTVSTLQVAHIDRKTAYETFGFAAVPDLLIYHADGSLAKRFRGETSVDAIKRHL
ncbi:peroxiredoxin family protein [Spirosoma pollinicola]|uniref:Thioredoxin domain-containing protein n=1 Tax=Spirosoma pollinicola TaxID=2057025 RepID=A0A2K8Z4T4_9BACT|nr:redoxin domain-containing protein [Spirosoma pollinicola]AUD04906.1 hypothetical protein CWM47_25510 [Spirosoma pollinicola]